MWTALAVVAAVALVGGCAIAFGGSASADIKLDRRIEVDPALNATVETGDARAPAPKPEHKEKPR